MIRSMSLFPKRQVGKDHGHAYLFITLYIVFLGHFLIALEVVLNCFFFLVIQYQFCLAGHFVVFSCFENVRFASVLVKQFAYMAFGSDKSYAIII